VNYSWLFQLSIGLTTFDSKIKINDLLSI